MQTLCSLCSSYMRTNNMESAKFATRNAIRQGETPRPFLFIVALEDIIKEEDAKKRLRIGLCGRPSFASEK